MTYCLGILVEQGLVMIADTRTNAGLDDISTYRKFTTVAVPGDRALVLASAGNLSLSQSVLGLLAEGFRNEETGEVETLQTVPTLFRAALLIGRAIRHVRALKREPLEQANVRFDVTFLLGSQIKGGPMELYFFYSAGNFIRCGPDAPYLQIGEPKYGKPILDRAVRHSTDLVQRG
jgi:putative proteasome-type protease